MEEETEITTAEGLQRSLTELDPYVLGRCHMHLFVNVDTDFYRLANVIEEDTNEDYHGIGARWTLRWCDDRDYTKNEWYGIVCLVCAMACHHLADDLEVSLPFKRANLDDDQQCADIGEFMQDLTTDTLKWSLNSFSLTDMKLGHVLVSEKEARWELIDFFLALRDYQGCTRKIFLTTNWVIDPSLLMIIAEDLPDLNELETLMVRFKEPPKCDAADQKYVDGMREAFVELKNGLESNFSLKNFRIWTYEEADSGSDSEDTDSEDQESPLSQLLSNLADEHLSLLLKLNYKCRSRILSMPLHRDTWLGVLAQFTDHHIDAVYYYLRRNAWMFAPDKSLEMENKCLKEELKKLKANKKRHREEMEAKDEEIKRLQAALEGKEKRQRADLEQVQKLVEVQLQCAEIQQQADSAL